MNTHRVKMKKCRLCEKRLPTYRFHKNRSKGDGLRPECWKCAAEMKAEQRARQDRRPPEPRGSIYHQKIPVERALPIFRNYMQTHPGITNNTNGSLVRAVHRMENELTTVRFDFLDRWLVEMGMSHLWHVPAERGGLADLYEPVLRRPFASAQTPAHPLADSGQVSAGRGSLSPQAASPSPSFAPGRGRTPSRKKVAA